MILSAEQIRNRLDRPFPGRLVITPLLDRQSQLSTGAGSVDLRLGLNFVLADPAVLGRLDPLDGEQAEDELNAYLRPIYVALGGRFVLHPRQFALAATMEYVRLPCGLAANVVGRSRWARVGLIIAMATYVHPCYAGCLTLEMQNLGDVPIELSPGLPIAQLILEEVAETDEVDLGQITCSIGPEFLPLLGDPDRKVLRRLRSMREEAMGDRLWREEP